MAAGGASLFIFAVISMLVMSSLGDPMPLCSDCETLCRANCTVEAQANCAKYCNGTHATTGECKGCTGAYFQQQCNPNCRKNCSNSCKKVVPLRPLCSDCHTVCSSKCDEDLETSCTESC
ncbi:hypothetical protein ZWY2020_050057 [Hordeum vulgare]|nr:hypothetical protein ZWY2020_050057 [Hordeum vulgare]